MTKAACFCAGFAACIAIVILVAVAVDWAWIDAGKPSISERVSVAAHHRVWVAVLVTATLLTPPLLLIGHLLLPQVVHVPRQETPSVVRDDGRKVGL